MGQMAGAAPGDDPDSTLIAIVGLSGLAALLWSPRRLSLTQLRTLELGMIALAAAKIAMSQYRSMLNYTLRDEGGMAQLVMPLKW